MRSSQYRWQKLRTLVSNQVMVRGLVLIDFYLVLLFCDGYRSGDGGDSDDGGSVINLYKITRQFRQSSKLWKIKTLQKMILKGRRGGDGGRGGGRGADYIGYTLYFIHPRCHLVLIDGKGDSYSVSAGLAGCVNLWASIEGSWRFHNHEKTLYYYNIRISGTLQY